MGLKTDKPIKLSLTLKGEAKAIAFLLTILEPYRYDSSLQRILKTVGAYFNYTVTPQ